MASSALPIGQVGPPLLRVVTPSALTQGLQQQDAAAAAASRPQEQAMDELARHLRTEWEMMRNHRNGGSGWNERLLHAQRTFNGKYEATKLADIKKFGGSDIYARVIALKCRGASALLREVYLGPEKAWGLEATPDPTLPDDIVSEAVKLVELEVQSPEGAGPPPDINQIRDRTNQLIVAAKRAAVEQAKKQAVAADKKLDDLLTEGGFYGALVEFITDLPLFPFACIKGPVVRIVPDVVWANGKAETQKKARLFWNRVSPFDLYWTPGVSNIRDAAVIERLRLTRADLNDLLGLPGYNEDNIRAVLDEYGRGGLHDWIDGSDSERAQEENRESPQMNRSGMIDCLEYHGNVQGRMLLEYGIGADQIPDPLRDYFVQAWLIGRYIIKVQISPNPRKRHPYFITSFEKVPGTPVGNALPDILADIQDAANAALRAVVNNMSIASGPQVVIDEERVDVLTNGDDLYPWKRWRTTSDPMAPQNNTNPPINFFSPQSHAQENFGIYKELTAIADELSAIPRYMSGSASNMGGAGRTSSGLAMLMGNASKILQMVSGNIDHDVMEPALQHLYDMVMLTDTSGMFRGDEAIRVRGVEVAVQRETARMRQIEFLTTTMNPMDAQIMGVEGRAKVLRSVSRTVGIEEEVVPPEDELKARMQAMAQAGSVAPPGGGGGGGSPPAPANTDPGVQDAVAMRGMTG